MRICIVPRWGGQGGDDWYPWLGRALSAHAIEIARLLPDPGAPAIAPSVAEFERIVASGVLADTVLVGHSVGCQVVLRTCERLSAPVHGVLSVAGWFWVDEPWDTLRPWMDAPLDHARIRKAAPAMRVLLSDDDPFTAEHQKNAAAWRERLGAEVKVIPGARHFNGAEEPAVLAALEDLLG